MSIEKICCIYDFYDSLFDKNFKKWELEIVNFFYTLSEHVKRSGIVNHDEISH